MAKLRAMVQKTRKVYIHNDLSGATSHIKQTIEAKLDRKDRRGIAFDYMACAVMLAFSFEANLNFVGYKLFQKDWNERARWGDKVNRVFQHLKIPQDRAARPYSSVVRLKSVRDLLAHGKPVESEHEEIVEATADDLDRGIDLSGEWEKACAHDSVFEAFDDVESLWRDMLQRADISHFDTLTRGNGGITVLETLEESAT